ncbi:MAG: hypothetical protein K6B43_04125 [Treponema sp.]|nr:hypothetical protein [Treponema sp.]
MKKKFLSVLLFLLAVCAFAESPDNTSPQIFSKITLCCDIFALPVGIAALLLSMYALRFNRMEISISYRASILEWYGKCIQTMEQLRIGKCGDKENLIARLSALSEEGFSVH